jgi:maltose alpha-D-glucosyltransferase / alpha-amylase
MRGAPIRRVADADWYKDAIIYELHIRAFHDSSGDGIGDIRGVIERLDYLVDLGVTAIWLLPFYPSPLRDGGYDIANYTDVHEQYGTREDLALLLRAAHDRGLRVITELVLNHTSIEHPWFQRARRAPPGSPLRDFYVWRDAPTGYADARIIFQDYETSNWAWDPIAKAYFWHRFYAHQPDLNFDNPAVHEALFGVIDFWLEMGVDGMRLDAVPYLYEREGTSCENLPETHAFLRRLRAHIDERFSDRMLLAEANQWPSDAAAYFGDGDECHMNFHFPLMPRMFMAVELEDSFPIVNILRRTPRIPPPCQWAIFLRNHDELTLEMVTDEDRDTMYRAYAAERTARLNLGIRRRLAPLMGQRRKVELMTALLLSLPGTPVLYYGDEIGMGDNIYLGDRDGVRTPMQWSGDRNGGFSRANPQKLYLPAIIDPEYHYEAINVETQQASSSSLLWWMKRLIAKRKEYRLFGRGEIEFVSGDNPRVLAFLREHDGELLLVVANLSRHVQAARLDLARHAPATPVEVFGRMRFPAITGEPYFISLGAHDFYWLAIERPAAESQALPTLVPRDAWTTVPRAPFARALAGYIAQRKWFRGRGRARKHGELVDLLELPSGRHAIALLRLDYEQGPPETYVVPLRISEEGGPDASTRIASIAQGDTRTVLVDAHDDDALHAALLEAMRAGTVAATGHGGPLTATALPALHDATEHLAPRAFPTEHGNCRVLYGDRFQLKLFRTLEDGPNAELEMLRWFATRAPNFRGVARLAGVLEYAGATLGTLVTVVPNQGEAWQLTLDALERFFEDLLARPPQPPPSTGRHLLASLPPSPEVLTWLGAFGSGIRLLGARTAELHALLADPTSEDLFAPEPFDLMHQQSIYGSASTFLARTFDLLRRDPAHAAIVERESEIDAAFARITRRRIDALRMRVHGDFHLGHVLWTGDDFVVIDFEGARGRSLAQRRAKRSPLRDVASMIRSLHYAASTALQAGRHRAEDIPRLEPWARAWSDWTAAAFLDAYLERIRVIAPHAVPANPIDLGQLLDFFVLERAIHEVHHALVERPELVATTVRWLTELLGPRG